MDALLELIAVFSLFSHRRLLAIGPSYQSIGFIWFTEGWSLRLNTSVAKCMAGLKSRNRWPHFYRIFYATTVALLLYCNISLYNTSIYFSSVQSGAVFVSYFGDTLLISWKTTVSLARFNTQPDLTIKRHVITKWCLKYTLHKGLYWLCVPYYNIILCTDKFSGLTCWQ